MGMDRLTYHSHDNIFLQMQQSTKGGSLNATIVSVKKKLKFGRIKAI